MMRIKKKRSNIHTIGKVNKKEKMNRSSLPKELHQMTFINTCINLLRNKLSLKIKDKIQMKMMNLWIDLRKQNSKDQ